MTTDGTGSSTLEIPAVAYRDLLHHEGLPPLDPGDSGRLAPFGVHDHGPIGKMTGQARRNNRLVGHIETDGVSNIQRNQGHLLDALDELL